MSINTVPKRLFKDADMSSTLVSDPIDLRSFEHVAYHIVWSGATASGDVYLDISAEIGGPVSWENIATVNVAGAGSQLWLDRNAPYIWARVRYVPASGTGLLQADVILKGDE